IAAASHAVLRGDYPSMSHGDNTRCKIAGNYVGVVDGTHNKALTKKCVAKAFGFDGRIGAHEGINGEDVVRSFAIGSKVLGCCRGAFKAELFTGGPDESYVAAFQVLAQRPGRRDQGSAADAIIKSARRGAASHQLVILLGNGDEVAGL